MDVFHVDVNYPIMCGRMSIVLGMTRGRSQRYK